MRQGVINTTLEVKSPRSKAGDRNNDESKESNKSKKPREGKTWEATSADWGQYRASLPEVGKCGIWLWNIVLACEMDAAN